jgi:DNA polymerase-1
VRARAVADLAVALDQDLERRGGTALLRDLELPLLFVLADCERTGIAADVEHLAALESRLREQVKQAAEQAYATVGHEFHLGSPKQLQALLFDELGLPKTKKIKTGYTTDADALQNLIGTHPVIEALLLHREMTRLLMVVEKQLLPTVADDGRIHTTFKQMVAATGGCQRQPQPAERPDPHPAGPRDPPGLRRRPGLRGADDRRLQPDRDADHGPPVRRRRAEGGLLDGGGPAHLRRLARLRRPGRAGRPGAAPPVKAMSYGLAYGLSAFGLAGQLRIPVDEAKEQMAAVLRALRRHPRLPARRRRAGPQGRLHLHDPRPPPLPARPDQRQRPAPLHGRAHGAQRPHPGQRRRHHQDRHAGRLARPGRGRHALAAAAAGPRRARARGGGGERESLEVLVRREMGGAYPLDVPLDVSVGVGRTWDDAGH